MQMDAEDRCLAFPVTLEIRMLYVGDVKKKKKDAIISFELLIILYIP